MPLSAKDESLHLEGNPQHPSMAKEKQGCISDFTGSPQPKSRKFFLKVGKNHGAQSFGDVSKGFAILRKNR